jgi:hypothetical protein
MRGDALSRFCSHCSKHVYDISQLTRSAAETLILEKEGRLCVRYYRRSDGRIMTQDCVAKSRFRKPAVFSAIVAFLVMVTLLIFRFVAGPGDHGQPNFLRRVEPFRTVMEWLYPAPNFVMGVMYDPPVTPAAPVKQVPVAEPEIDE